jgi:pulcherriminic acid synthase
MRRAYDLACSRKLAEYLTPIIKQRQEHPGDDLISTMATVVLDGHSMSTEDIVALSLNIIMAATEPAAKTIALLFYHLLEHPDQLRSLEADRRQSIWLLGRGCTCAWAPCSPRWKSKSSRT